MVENVVLSSAYVNDGIDVETSKSTQIIRKIDVTSLLLIFFVIVPPSPIKLLYLLYKI